MLHPCPPANFSRSRSVIEATSLTDSTDNFVTMYLARLLPTPLIPTRGIISDLQPCCILVLASPRICNNVEANESSLSKSRFESLNILIDDLRSHSAASTLDLRSPG